MHVISLHRIVNDAKLRRLTPRGAHEREPDARIHELTPQRRHTRPERDMHRLPGAMDRTRTVGGRRTFDSFAASEGQNFLGATAVRQRSKSTLFAVPADERIRV